MVSLIALLVVVSLSILITRIATTALMLTGLSTEAARFQARSALSGTGFTTDEAEQVVAHPVRRRIIMLLMILQNAGVVTAASTLILSFVETGGAGVVVRRALILTAGLSVLVYAANSEWVDRNLSRVIEWALDRYTGLDVTDYYRLLNLRGEYTVGRVDVNEGNWLASKKISELQLPEEGVLILGVIRRDDSYVGAPRGRYTINVGDTLVLYGEEDSLEDLNKRMADQHGEHARQRAEEQHSQAMDVQDEEQRSYQEKRDREIRSHSP